MSLRCSSPLSTWLSGQDCRRRAEQLDRLNAEAGLDACSSSVAQYSLLLGGASNALSIPLSGWAPLRPPRGLLPPRFPEKSLNEVNGKAFAVHLNSTLFLSAHFVVAAPFSMVTDAALIVVRGQ